MNRREILKGGALAIGAAVATGAAILPRAASAAPRPGRRHNIVDSFIPQFREAYFAELERLADLNRARFESGELHGYRDNSEGVDRIAAVCEQHFGLGVTIDKEREPGWTWFVADDEVAYMILAVSPSADATHDGGGWNHIAYHAREAAAWDLLAAARARGWVQIEPDECPTAEETAWAQERWS